MTYYVSENKVQRKYSSKEDFISAVKAGRVKGNNFYWTKGMKSWQRVHSFIESHSGLVDSSVKSIVEKKKGGILAPAFVAGVCIAVLVFLNYLAKADILTVLLASFGGGLLGFTILFLLSLFRKLISRGKPTQEKVA